MVVYCHFSVVKTFIIQQADVEEEHVRISRAALSLGETNENNTYYHNASNCYIIYIEDMSFDFYNLTDKDSSSYSKISHPLIGDYTFEDNCASADNDTIRYMHIHFMITLNM